MTIWKEERILFLPPMCILVLYIFTQHFVVGSGLEKTATALAGYLTLACFACGGRLADIPAVSIWWSIFWSLLGTAIPFLAAEFVLYEDLDFLTSLCEEVFLPIVLFLIPCLGVLTFLQRSRKWRVQKKILWYGWLLWLGAAHIFLAFTGSIWVWDAAFLGFWFPLVLMGLPFLLPALYRGLKHLFPHSGLLPAMIYFSLSAFFYGLTTDVFYSFVHGVSVADPVVGLYQIVLCVLVFWLENKADPMASRSVAAALSAVYGLGCGTVAFFTGERLREILFHLGGPAVLIEETVRDDWLGYHAAAAMSFIQGDLDAMNAAFAGTQNNYYQLFFYGENPLFPWLFWILAAMVLLAVAELVLLMRSQPYSPLMQRCKRYLVGGIVLRTALAVFCTVGMFLRGQMDFPFTGSSVFDFLFLWTYAKAMRQEGSL